MPDRKISERGDNSSRDTEMALVAEAYGCTYAKDWLVVQPAAGGKYDRLLRVRIYMNARDRTGWLNVTLVPSRIVLDSHQTLMRNDDGSYRDPAGGSGFADLTEIQMRGGYTVTRYEPLKPSRTDHVEPLAPAQALAYAAQLILDRRTPMTDEREFISYLPRAERAIVLVSDLIEQVAEGGFAQYFSLGRHFALTEQATATDAPTLYEIMLDICTAASDEARMCAGNAAEVWDTWEETRHEDIDDAGHAEELTARNAALDLLDRRFFKIDEQLAADAARLYLPQIGTPLTPDVITFEGAQ